MGKIYKYRKVTDTLTTYCLIEPDYNLIGNSTRVKELATYDGWTYISVPDGLILPEQPGQIELIECESPQEALIDMQVVELIRRKYSINDELKILRLVANGDLTKFEAYNSYVEECRVWGVAEKAKLE